MFIKQGKINTIGIQVRPPTIDKQISMLDLTKLATNMMINKRIVLVTLVLVSLF